MTPPLSGLKHFQFEMLRIPNHTACRFAEKARFFRLLWAGRRCAAASRFTFFKGERLYSEKFTVGKRRRPICFLPSASCLPAARHSFLRWFPTDIVPRQGLPLRPLRWRSDGAGAKAIPCARRADGAPQQARTSPGKAGKVRADAHATRGGRGTAQFKRRLS